MNLFIRVIIIVIPVIVGIYLARKKTLSRTDSIILLIVLILLISCIIYDKRCDDLVKQKLSEAVSKSSEGLDELYELEKSRDIFYRHQEMSIEQQELLKKGFSQEYINELGIAPLASLYYVEACTLYADSNYEKAIERLKACLDNLIVNDYLKVNSNMLIGSCLYFLGEFDEALKYYKKALVVSITLKNPNDRLYGMSSSLSGIGFIYYVLNKYGEALISLQEALELNRSISEDYYSEQQSGEGSLASKIIQHGNVRSNSAYIQIRMGDIYFYQLNDFEEALYKYKQSLEIYKEKKNDLQLIFTYRKISSVYSSMNKPEKAIEICNIALEVNKKYEEKNGETESLIDKAFRFTAIGGIYRTLKKPEIALESYQKVLKINDILKRERGKTHALRSIGDIYFEYLNKPIIALEKYKEALKYAKQIDDEKMIISLENKINFIIETLKND